MSRNQVIFTAAIVFAVELVVLTPWTNWRQTIQYANNAPASWKHVTPSSGPLDDDAVKDLHINRNESSKERVPSAHEHCIVHIHGFHHSGTGFLRQTVFQGLGGAQFASMHQNTGVVEDEGQHLQNIYPTYRQRKTTVLCTSLKEGRVSDDTRRTFVSLYYCPRMLSIANMTGANEALFQQWAQYWDLTKPFLIQKTPTFDVLFLERMKLETTVHVIAMRHPFAWHSDLTRMHRITWHSDMTRRTVDLMLPVIWINVWAHVLEQLSRGDIQSYIVVNYESLVQSHAEVSTEIAEYIKGVCGLADQPRNTRALAPSRRALGLHEGNSTNFLRPSEGAVNLLRQCEKDILCRNLMTDLGPILFKFGYSWDILGGSFFSGENIGKEKILFTSKRPPPLELVQKIKPLASKYS